MIEIYRFGEKAPPRFASCRRESRRRDPLTHIVTLSEMCVDVVLGTEQKTSMSAIESVGTEASFSATRATSAWPERKYWSSSSCTTDANSGTTSIRFI